MKFHMVEFCLAPAALVVFARRVGLSAGACAADPGYAAHAWMAAAFGADAPRPFRVSSLAPEIRVLGYSALTGKELRARALENAEPSALAALVDGVVLSKPMPEHFERGGCFAFELESAPVRRHGSVERDAFLMAIERAPEARLSRESVYLEWFRERLPKGIEVMDVSLKGFQLLRRVRKGREGESSRKQSWVTQPRAVFQGTLRVLEPDDFSRMLRLGLGRGKGLGDGMVTIRRA